MPPRQRRTPGQAGADASPRARRRRPLRWYDTEELGPVPDCHECQRLLFSPMFMEAVYSVSIDRPGSPADLARRTVTAYHDHDHAEV